MNLNDKEFYCVDNRLDYVIKLYDFNNAID